MQIALRQAGSADFDYCAKLYFAAMETTIPDLNPDAQGHAARFRGRWDAAETRIITCDRADVGYLQAAVEADALLLKQLFVAVPLQRHGIGTQVLHRLIDEAARAGRAVTLGVVKANRALRLYRRLGFAVTQEDEREFYMRREPDAAVPPRG